MSEQHYKTKTELIELFDKFAKSAIKEDVDLSYKSNKLLYGVFSTIKSRCYNESVAQYNDWGGRGIKVCYEWLNNRKRFMSWALSNGYENGLQIDRIDNDKGYSPNNCRWVTRQENCKNRRIRADNKSGFRGIVFHHGMKKWRAKITIMGASTYNGSFIRKTDAAIARDAYIVSNNIGLELNFSKFIQVTESQRMAFRKPDTATAEE